jgi:prepilin-type N-terminal cleavage/methylation domain-containing protein
LKVQWLDQTWTLTAARADRRRARRSAWWKLARLDAGVAPRNPGMWGGKRRGRLPRLLGFTVLEMLVVITIIGFLAAVAMPHLAGMSKSNAMTTATQQMLNDVGLARQMAMSHRTTVYMVFVSTNAFPANSAPTNDLSAYTNLMLHQYSAYALFSARSVGDQPGRSIPQYLTSWKTLPDGVFFPVYMFNTNPSVIALYTTNTLSGRRNYFPVIPFPLIPPNPISVPFPGVDAFVAGNPFTVNLPCIAFSPLGQLTVNYDLYIPLARGTVRNLPGGVAAANESPAGNSVNNCNLVHIDWLTARAKIEQNQF